MGLFGKNKNAEKRQATRDARAEKIRGKWSGFRPDLVEALTTVRALQLKSHVKQLDEMTPVDERIQAVAFGADGSELEYCVLTDRAIHARTHKPGVFGKTQSEVFPLETISTIEMESRLSATVKINASGTSFAVEGLVAEDAQRLVDLARRAMAERRSAPPPNGAPSDMEQLKQLGDLHAAGVLTDEEFADQKARILGRM